MPEYVKPTSWIRYDRSQVSEQLVNVKAAILSLGSLPYQRRWVEELQEVEMKREIAGTTRIEGADFTERELNDALNESMEELRTRSQRQARAAKRAYDWIGTLPEDYPLSKELVLNIHRNMILGADDDHCEPGKLRARDENVLFGAPRHRGVNGGAECEQVFDEFVHALSAEYMEHDPIIRALAAHYHIAAMHPFLDGNGRTARALEALLLQRAGLKKTCFVSISNYYYEEKRMYLSSLNASNETGHDLTPFLKFGLHAIQMQVTRILDEIQVHISKALYRDLMYDLFNRMKTTRKRVIAKRQLKILERLLRGDVEGTVDEAVGVLFESYINLKKPGAALARDLRALKALGAISLHSDDGTDFKISARLEWPTETNESQFMENLKKLPQAKTHPLLKL